MLRFHSPGSLIAIIYQWYSYNNCNFFWDAGQLINTVGLSLGINHTVCLRKLLRGKRLISFSCHPVYSSQPNILRIGRDAFYMSTYCSMTYCCHSSCTSIFTAFGSLILSGRQHSIYMPGTYGDKSIGKRVSLGKYGFKPRCKQCQNKLLDRNTLQNALICKTSLYPYWKYIRLFYTCIQTHVFFIKLLLLYQDTIM